MRFGADCSSPAVAAITPVSSMTSRKQDGVTMSVAMSVTMSVTMPMTAETSMSASIAAKTTAITDSSAQSMRGIYWTDTAQGNSVTDGDETWGVTD